MASAARIFGLGLLVAVAAGCGSPATSGPGGDATDTRPGETDSVIIPDEVIDGGKQPECKPNTFFCDPAQPAAVMKCSLQGLAEVAVPCDDGKVCRAGKCASPAEGAEGTTNPDAGPEGAEGETEGIEGHEGVEGQEGAEGNEGFEGVEGFEGAEGAENPDAGAEDAGSGDADGEIPDAGDGGDAGEDGGVPIGPPDAGIAPDGGIEPDGGIPDAGAPDGGSCSPVNACGGCKGLTNTVGDKCGDCGQWVCNGPDAVKCDDPGKKSCLDYVTCAQKQICGTCPPKPMEICDGKDNDCDSTTAEEGEQLDCAAGLACKSGACCKDECPAFDGKQCVDSASYKTCGNFDGDACLELGPTKFCNAGEKCENSACATTDAGIPDAGIDAGIPDAGVDAGVQDAGIDAGVTDGGVGNCNPACESGKECSNGLCVYPGMVGIPAGAFMMGCNSAVDTECKSHESPYHQVTLSAYMIDKYEVTVSEYKACVDASVCSAAGTGTNCNWGVNGRETHPINCVDWNQSLKYCQWKGTRLPTEAEWEKAARGTDGRKYPWGNDALDCTRGVHSANGCTATSTAPVGSKPAGASPYGLNDMVGNVWEWVNDWYGAGYYATSPAVDPAGPSTGADRVLRGGSWSYDSSYLRVSLRDRFNNWTDGGGFRCARYTAGDYVYYDMKSNAGWDFTGWTFVNAADGYAWYSGGATYDNKLIPPKKLTPGHETIFYQLSGKLSYSLVTGLANGKPVEGTRFFYRVVMDWAGKFIVGEYTDTGDQVFSTSLGSWGTGTVYCFKIDVHPTKGAKYYQKSCTDGGPIDDSGWNLLHDSTTSGSNNGRDRGTAPLGFGATAHDSGGAGDALRVLGVQFFVP